MKAWPTVPVLLALAACSSFNTGPSFEIPAVCEDQVYADPTVKDLILKGSGSDNYRINHMEQLKYAKIDAARRCMRQKGLLPPGGVARPRVEG